MTHSERFVAYMTGEPADRPPYWLYWGPWGSGWERWRREGMPAQFQDFAAVKAHFDADPQPCTVPVHCGPCPRLERTVLEESADYVVFTDGWGIKRRDYKGGMSMSQFLEFPVKSRRDWEAFRDERLDPDDPRRLDGDWRGQAAGWMQAGWPIQLGYFPDVGIFGTVRWLLGDEECLIAFIEQPALVHEIMERMTDIYLTVFGKVVAAGVRVDVIHIWEDMCGRQGPLISPRMWTDFLGPCYRRIQRFAAEHDIRLISVDTDGKPDLIVPPMLAHGVNYVFPWEVAAGCDVNVVRATWPEMALMGGIDKRPLAVDHAATDRELERVRPAVETGRYIPGADHLIPDDVSWDNYSYYARRLKLLVGKA